MSAISVAEARRIIVGHAHPLSGQATVALEQSLGRVLSADVISPVSLPLWANASMDGYAVHAADIIGATRDHPRELPVRETVAAGGGIGSELARGVAVRIMTGAPTPPGADSVVRVEDTDRGIERVRVFADRDAGKNIRAAGEDVEAGHVVLGAGSLIGPAQLGVLASVGAANVAVHRLPRVAVISTGDELVDVSHFDQVIGGKRIVSSNGYTLRAAVAQAGAIVEDFGIVHDDPAAVRSALERAFTADLVLTSGGVSAGAFDHVRAAIIELGGRIEIERVTMRPGAPLGFAMVGNAMWIGLPGNPVSTMIGFELFARSAIRRMRGERQIEPLTVTVVSDDDITLAAPLTHFFRVTLRVTDTGELRAALTGPQGSGLLTSMARADALMIVDAERGGIRKGERALAIPLGSTVGN